MCFRQISLLPLILVFMTSCSSYKKIHGISSTDMTVEISLHDEETVESVSAEVIDSIRNEIQEGPVIMNAMKDNDSGEMVAVDVISASKVVARFRNVAERNGQVSVSFDVHVPSVMTDSRWQLKLYPRMYVAADTVLLDPLYVTGAKYRERQLRGYERYERFLASIVTDTADFLHMRQLEIFLKRNFPDTYAMKRDSSIVSDSAAESLFGVTRTDALRHYVRHMKLYMNERRKARVGYMYDKYVPDPILTEGVRLDTVLSVQGDFIYRYVHTFRSRPGLRKVRMAIDGEIYENGGPMWRIPVSDDLTFYVSSLTSMADTSMRFRKRVIERVLYENVRANIDFAQGSAAVDTSLAENAGELERMLACVREVVDRKEYVLDSLVIVASCSPEGRYDHNRRLSLSRAESVKEYMGRNMNTEWNAVLRTSCVPEDWRRLRELVCEDAGLTETAKERILALTGDVCRPDAVEMSLSRMREYAYLKKNIYPKLRNVRFDFHMHRVGMCRDTVCSTEPDTLYMSGVAALRNMDYRKAVSVLGPYGDYNSALAFIAADMNHTAMKVLEGLGDGDARVCYLKAMVLSRLGAEEEAGRYFELSVAYDPYMAHRANLDPEMYRIVEQRRIP